MTQNMQDVAQIFSDKREEIIAWFTQQYRDVSPLLYSSVDIRDSGYKVAPVDTNIYPAGFNNLDALARDKASEEMRKFFAASYPHAKKIGIIPENHTRNAGYISNLVALSQIIAQAGYEVVLGRVEEGVSEPVALEGLDGQTITSYPFIAQDSTLATSEGFVPDVLVMNMDMTSGVPALLQHITQPIVPSVTLGWYQRRKSMHFSTYQTLVDDFASIMQVQPWLLSALHQQCGRVNFKEKTGLECVALNVERVLHQLRERFAQHEIQDTPYVFIKADSGTYGMGIMTARSGDEVMEMNKKIRNKMDVIKEGAVNTEVIIQEGVPTALQREQHAAEPFMYLVNGQVVGGIWRINASRDAYVSLNASGVSFAPMQEACTLEHAQGMVLVYAVVAMLASLAAAKEKYSVIN